jgi:hypothetical protein
MFHDGGSEGEVPAPTIIETLTVRINLEELFGGDLSVPSFRYRRSI